MLAGLIISAVACLGLGIVLMRGMPPNGTPMRYPASVRVFWKLSVVAVIALGAGYIVQKHADAQQSDIEYRIDELENQVNDLESQISDLDDKLDKAERRTRFTNAW